MNVDDYAALRLLIRDEEGLRLKPYTDTAGRLTIGYGRNLTDVGISQLEASDLLENDLTRAVNDVQQALPFFAMLDGVRQIVLVDMCFNMGIARLKTFVKMLAFVQAGKFFEAAQEMLNSQWADQVGARATRLASAMASGEIK